MRRFTRFLLSMMKVGCIGFGGGSALIPVMEAEFVEKQKLDKKIFDKDVIIASITPGALPVELAASIGRRNFGYRGMILGAVVMALPGSMMAFFLLSMLANVQTTILSNIKIASVGVSAYIVFLLAHYIVQMLKQCKKDNITHFWKANIVMLGVLILSCGKNLYKLIGLERTPLLAVSTIHILMAAFFFVFYTGMRYTKKNLILSFVLCSIYLLGHGKAGLIQSDLLLSLVEVLMCILAVAGIVKSIRQEKWIGSRNDVRPIIKDCLVWIVFLIVLCIPAVLQNWKSFLFIGRGMLSAIMSFGGGDAYLTIADGLFVETGMITTDVYYGDIVSVVNILPGSILCKTLTGIGYYYGTAVTGTILGGASFALAGLASSIMMSGMVFMVIYRMYDRLNNLSIFQIIGKWIRPIVGGLLLNIMLSLCNQSRGVCNYTGLAFTGVVSCIVGMAAADYVIVRYSRIPAIFVLGLNIIAVYLIVAMV